MKNILFLIILILSNGLNSSSNTVLNFEILDSNTSIAYHVKTPNESVVYVCGGQYAEKFHSISNCRGLNNCKGGIYYINSQQEAINQGYEYCSICWR